MMENNSSNNDTDKAQQQSSSTTSRFDNVFYNVRNKLDEEVRARIPQQLDRAQDGEDVYVLEWYDYTFKHAGNNVSNIFGCGMGSLDGKAKYILTDCQPGLFVCSWKISVLRTMVSIFNYNLVEYPNLGYFSVNNFNALNALDQVVKFAQTPEDVDASVDRPAVLCKIITPTFTAAKELHRELNRQYRDRVKDFAAIPFYWDIYRLVLYELYARGFDTSRYIKCWFDYRMNNSEDIQNRHKSKDVQMPFITFDVETSSTDKYRVPTGEDVDDVLVTSAIYHERTEMMYSLVYLPIDRENFSQQSNLLKSVREKKYKVTTEFFHTERELLIRTMELLNIPQKYHYLVGYNSANYDIKYLLKRCVFYNLPTTRFVYKSCFTYGMNQIHVDMYRVARMLYTLSNYKLSKVSQYLLNTTKDDVNAVDIRFTFAVMSRCGKVPDDDPDDSLLELKAKGWPTVKDIIDYNEKDTLLVFDILKHMNFEMYVNSYAIESGISISSINENYNRIKYPLMCWCEKIMLPERVVISQFNEMTRSIMMPNRMYDKKDLSKYMDDYQYRTYNSTSLLGMRQVANSEKKRYPGGVNYCYGAFMVKNVTEYDYVQAYLRVIIKLNLSDETCCVIRASTLRSKLKYMTDRSILSRYFRVFDYRTHNGENKIETRVITHQFVYENVHCGCEFSITDDCELEKRCDEPVILILISKRGVLSRAVEKLVEKRNEIKDIRPMLESFNNMVDTERSKIIELMEDDEEEEENNEKAESIDLDFRDDGNIDDDDFDENIASPIGNFEKDDDDNFDENIASPIGNFEKDDDDDNDSSNIVTSSNSNNNDNDAEQQQQQQTIKFQFENDHVYVKNGILVFNFPKDWTPDYKIFILDALKENIKVEILNYQNKYLRLKTFTLSVYGIIGSIHTELAAIITAIPRMTLIQQSQLLVQSGRKVYYMDTDCLHVDDGPDESKNLNTKFSYAQLDSKSLGICMYNTCKTYYKYIENDIKYGANSRGPSLWRGMVKFFDKRARDIVYLDEIRGTCRDFFLNTYNRIHDTCVSHKSYESGLSLLTREIKLTKFVPTIVYREYLLEKYPEMASTLRHNVFPLLDAKDVYKLIYRPEIQLTSTSETTLERYFTESLLKSSNNDHDDDINFTNNEEIFDERRMKKRLLSINLYKFFLPVITTCYNITFAYCRENNKPYHVILHPVNFYIMMVSGFLDAMRDRARVWGIGDFESDDDCDDDDDKEEIIVSKYECKEKFF